MGQPVRLQRYLASAGVAARRKAEELITAGRVTVNGEIVTTLGTKVDPDTAEVTVDGEAVMALDAFYVLFNKPKACITAVTDDRGRPTVMDYLPNLPVPVKPVGRLDFYSEGVLLLTNDGELAAKLLAPASHVAKTYHVKIHGQLSADHVKVLRDGVTLDDGTTTMPAEISVLPGESKHTWLGITIHEGKHRQIHRMIEALGYSVDKLQRVAFANLTFHDLRVGDARELTQLELNALRDLVGLDHSTVARGRWRSDREATDIPRRARAKARDEAEAAHAEAEANRERNAAARAAAGGIDGDAWDGEGDPDRDADLDSGLGADEGADFERGAPLPHAPTPAGAPAPRARSGGKPYESRAVGRRGPDDTRARRDEPEARAPRSDARGPGSRAPRRDDGPPSRAPRRDDSGPSRGPRRDDARGAGSRGPRRDDTRTSGGRAVRAYSDRFAGRSDAPRGEATGGGGRGARAFGPGETGGARGARSDGPRGPRSAGPGDRPFTPRGEGAGRGAPRGERSFTPRGEGAGRGAPRGDRPFTPRGEGAGRGAPRGERSFTPRGEGAGRGAPRGDRPFTPRGEGAGRGAPRGDRPFTPRGESAGRGARPFTPRGDGPRGPRSAGPGGARGDRPYTPRGEGAGGRGERTFAPRGEGAGRGAPRGDRPFTPRGEGAGRGAPRGDRPFTPRGEGASRGAPRGDRPFTPRGEGAARGAPRGDRDAGPPRDKGRWRDRAEGPRTRDEAKFGSQEGAPRATGSGARAPSPRRGGQGRSFGAAKPGARPPKRGR